MKKLETGLRGWDTIVPRAVKKEVKPAPAIAEGSSGEDVEVVEEGSSGEDVEVERAVIPGRLALCKFCSVPCLATVELGAMCKRCIALPPGDRRREDRVMEICKTCNKTFTYRDYPERPYNGLINCSDCRKPSQ